MPPEVVAHYQSIISLDGPRHPISLAAAARLARSGPPPAVTSKCKVECRKGRCSCMKARVQCTKCCHGPSSRQCSNAIHQHDTSNQSLSPHNLEESSPERYVLPYSIRAYTACSQSYKSELFLRLPYSMIFMATHQVQGATIRKTTVVFQCRLVGSLNIIYLLSDLTLTQSFLLYRPSHHDAVDAASSRQFVLAHRCHKSESVHLYRPLLKGRCENDG